MTRYYRVIIGTSVIRPQSEHVKTAERRIAMARDTSHASVFHSKAAAPVTGLCTETLRVRERCYVVIDPRASSGRQRLYLQAGTRRLNRIKWLVELGRAIACLAQMLSRRGRD
jgi:MerR HTH family regulatory protein